MDAHLRAVERPLCAVLILRSTMDVCAFRLVAAEHERSTDFVGHEGLGPIPRRIAVTAKCEELVEDHAVRREVDGFDLRPLHERALLVNAAEHQKVRARIRGCANELLGRRAIDGAGGRPA